MRVCRFKSVGSRRPPNTSILRQRQGESGHLDVSIVVCIHVFPTAIASLVLGCRFIPFASRLSISSFAYSSIGYPRVPELYATGLCWSTSMERKYHLQATHVSASLRAISRILRNSSQVEPSPSSFQFSDSWVSSAKRQNAQPSRYHASTSWLSDAMTPCSVSNAGSNSDNSKNSLMSDSPTGFNGTFWSSVRRRSS